MHCSLHYTLNVVYFCMTALFCSALSAEPQTTIPETLTLEFALKQVDGAHPDLERARAVLDLATAEQQQADSLTGTRVSIESRLRYIEPNNSSRDQSNDDNSVGIFVEKDLYDFGRSAAAERAASSLIEGGKLGLIDVANQRRIEIMEKYFATLLSDLEYLRDNEDVAITFIRFENTQRQRALGRVSDVEVLNRQNIFLQARVRRASTEVRQRSNRAQLAIAMGFPGQLSAELKAPTTLLPAKLVDVELLQAEAVKNNISLLVLRAQRDAAIANVEFAKAGDNAVITGEAQATENSRQVGSRDDLRIGLQLRIPLFSGGATRARVSKQRAELRRINADYSKQQTLIEQSVLDVWLQLNNQKIQRQQAQAQLEHSELLLDQSRALYELEAQSNFGEALVQISEAQRQVAETEYQNLLLWARLDALLGKVVGVQAKGEQ